MSSRRERIERAIDRLEKEVVNPIVKDISISFSIQIIYHIGLLTLGILTNLNPSLSTIIGTLGLGSLGIGANFERFRKAVSKFLTDRRALKTVTADLRIRLDLCPNTDEECLKEVEELLKKVLQTLR